MTISISDVKNAIVYESLNDTMPKRTVSEHANIINETNTQMIFRSSWRWIYFPISCNDNVLIPYPDLIQKCIDGGYSFELRSKFITELKSTNPDLLIVAAIPAQKIDKTLDVNEFTGETFNATQLASMIFDPRTVGINKTPQEFQTVMAQYTDGYYPDISNPTVQNLILGWCKKAIDSGVDGIWIDLLYSQAINIFQLAGNNINNIGVQNSYSAANKLIDDIHAYGLSQGKTIYVGTWLIPVSEFINRYGMAAPNVDFVTMSPSPTEVLNRVFEIDKWNDIITSYNSAFGNKVKFFTFIDWAAGSGSQIANFSQKLTTEQQNKFLIDSKTFFDGLGITFIYPVHGGVMGSSPATTPRLNNGTTRYDSIVFNNYETIKQLMTGEVIPPIIDTGVGWFRKKTCITPTTCLPNWGLVGIGGLLAYLILKK